MEDLKYNDHQEIMSPEFFSKSLQLFYTHHQGSAELNRNRIGGSRSDQIFEPIGPIHIRSKENYRLPTSAYHSGGNFKLELSDIFQKIHVQKNLKIFNT